ncbi:NAD(P)-binding protein [Aureobasidium namibiae CBS 147.97]|uniref:NAD(P)-binding protein n=1 Tax=Aureobasidium namibiae CBS 147.97 TaxID=1043004 RepID=A0A074W723_9PEZI|nr:NAD(P)-binding protein [Aureobasidium namibiae CBS 147.97]KEQ68930.1 NAD(P)-binding protein [Aureobasidium namibiae CBS 147.97]
MAPIRIGLIGLSTSSKATNWAVLAHLPYLQSPLGQSHYKIVALCNSSVESAKKSIAHFNLSPTIKAYGSARDLVTDPDVELVVNVTGVESHYDVLLPVVKAGKDVYSELPLASNMAQMRELIDAARAKGVKTIFGLQGQAHPVVHLIKKMIVGDKIGKPLSTTLTATTGSSLDRPLPIAFKMLAERKAGGNFATIWFLHSINCLLDTFGELDSFNSIMGTDHPALDLIDPSKGTEIIDTIAKDCPDNTHLQGRFSSGTLLTYQLRAGPSFPGEPGCRWIINGTKGDILITNPRGCFDIEHSGIKIQYRKAGENTAEEVMLEEDNLSGLEHPAQNVGRVFEAFAKGEAEKYADWKTAMRRHSFIDEMFERGDREGAFD